MASYDILLLLILAIGAVWINSNILKKDFFSNPDPTTDTVEQSDRHPITPQKAQNNLPSNS